MCKRFFGTLISVNNIWDTDFLGFVDDNKGFGLLDTAFKVKKSNAILYLM